VREMRGGRVLTVPLPGHVGLIASLDAGRRGSNKIGQNWFWHLVSIFSGLPIVLQRHQEISALVESRLLHEKDAAPRQKQPVLCLERRDEVVGQPTQALLEIRLDPVVDAVAEIVIGKAPHHVLAPLLVGCFAGPGAGRVRYPSNLQPAVVDGLHGKVQVPVACQREPGPVVG
jgi:hypothetical protein